MFLKIDLLIITQCNLFHNIKKIAFKTAVCEKALINEHKISNFCKACRHFALF